MKSLFEQPKLSDLINILNTQCAINYVTKHPVCKTILHMRTSGKLLDLLDTLDDSALTSTQAKLKYESKGFMTKVNEYSVQALANRMSTNGCEVDMVIKDMAPLKVSIKSLSREPIAKLYTTLVKDDHPLVLKLDEIEFTHIGFTPTEHKNLLISGCLRNISHELGSMGDSSTINEDVKSLIDKQLKRPVIQVVVTSMDINPLGFLRDACEYGELSNLKDLSPEDRKERLVSVSKICLIRSENLSNIVINKLGRNPTVNKRVENARDLNL